MIESIMHNIMRLEAINSVAMSHPDECACDICRAANGDQDAVAVVLATLAERERDQ